MEKYAENLDKYTGSCGENRPSALSLPEAIQVPTRSRAMPRPPNPTHLHKEKEGLLDAASDTAMAVKSRGVSFSGKRQSNRKRSGKHQKSRSAIYKNEMAGIPSLSQSTEQNGC